MKRRKCIRKETHSYHMNFRTNNDEPCKHNNRHYKSNLCIEGTCRKNHTLDCKYFCSLFKIVGFIANLMNIDLWIGKSYRILQSCNCNIYNQDNRNNLQLNSQDTHTNCLLSNSTDLVLFCTCNLEYKFLCNLSLVLLRIKVISF